jgi:hypothetical protein
MVRGVASFWVGFVAMQTWLELLCAQMKLLEQT